MDANWSSLPLDILTVIAMKLGALEDFIYFSVVCSLWNHVSSIIKKDWKALPAVPWLLLAENTKDNPDYLRKIFNICNNKCYKLNLPETFGKRCWGSAYGWIAMLDRELNVKLFNPITKAQICFPSLQMLPKPPEYAQEFHDNRENFLNWCCSKIIVLKVSQSSDHEFVIMILYENNMSLAFSRHGDQSWTPVFLKKRVDCQYVNRIADVVGVGNFALILDVDGSIVYFNFKESPSFQLVKPIDYSPPIKHEWVENLRQPNYNIYLLQSNSDLLMIIRHINIVSDLEDESDYDYDIVYRTWHFEVFKFVPEHKHWEQIKDLGEVALFIGSNTSMSVSVSNTKFLQRSCIYFTDDQSELWEEVKEFGGHDMGVYDNKNDEMRQFYEGDDRRGSLNCPPIWFIPQF